ncbi:hypothetical protein KIJ04_08100 [Leuconostoc gelidum subsp. gelidum]|uniref:hypothetical protein n=1 Tax=Leuconostoc gelidum TaxID=1244 RepID=UPI001CC7F229|nr:hypothetical protein [Leuconostoc gelidum]MBZ6014696.1 hypothetical protein [Leuconostoc gelidum subsp. gelidum]
MDKTTSELFVSSESISNALPAVAADANYWLIRTAGGRYFTDFSVNNFVGIDWNKLSLKELTELSTKKEMLIQKLKELYPYKEEPSTDLEGDTTKIEIKERTYTSWANQILRFFHEVKAGDVVLIPDNSSRNFRVGYIVSNIFEEPDSSSVFKDPSEYEKSRYIKRYSTRWFGTFLRDDADPAIYKMTNTHHVITNINAYKPFINRVLFDAYREGNIGHYTFKVNQESDINAVSYTKYTSSIVEMIDLIEPDPDMKLKTNVQSHGIVEIIAGVASLAAVSGLLYLVFSKKEKLSMTLKSQLFSFTIKKSSKNIELSEISIADRQMTVEEAKAQSAEEKTKIENVERALEVAKKLREASEQLDGEAPESIMSMVSKMTKTNFESNDDFDDEDVDSE